MNRRDVGEAFERQVLNKLPSQLNFSTTSNSGARMNDGDLVNRDLIIECKVKSNSIVGITETELNHVQKQAMRDFRDWALVVKNRRDEQLVVISLDYFITLLES